MRSSTACWPSGTQETSALEQASAFGVFANHGVRVEPTPVLRILDVKGETVEDNRKPNGKQVISAAVADNVTSVLQGVIEKGTARRAEIGRPAAGKTGTSENWENAWFVGFTPTLSTAVWMGHPKANMTMANVHGVPHVVGGSLPAMIWHDFMAEAVKDVEPLPFTVAAPILPSRAEFEAKARVVAEQRLIRAGGLRPPARPRRPRTCRPAGRSGRRRPSPTPRPRRRPPARPRRRPRRRRARRRRPDGGRRLRRVVNDHDDAASAATAHRPATGRCPSRSPGLTRSVGDRVRIAPHAPSTRAAGSGCRICQGMDNRRPSRYPHRTPVEGIAPVPRAVNATIDRWAAGDRAPRPGWTCDVRGVALDDQSGKLHVPLLEKADRRSPSRRVAAGELIVRRVEEFLVEGAARDPVVRAGRGWPTSRRPGGCRSGPTGAASSPSPSRSSTSPCGSVRRPGLTRSAPSGPPLGHDPFDVERGRCRTAARRSMCELT